MLKLIGLGGIVVSFASCGGGGGLSGGGASASGKGARTVESSTPAPAAASGSGATAASASGGGSPAADAVVEDAGKSAEVTGAFLTSCGPSGEAAAGAKADDAVFGCGVFDRTKTLVPHASVTSVSARIDGAPVEMTLLPATNGLWSEVFVMSAAQLAKLEGLEAAYQVGDQAFPAVKTEFTGKEPPKDLLKLNQYIHTDGAGTDLDALYAEAGKTYPNLRDEGYKLTVLAPTSCALENCAFVGGSTVLADDTAPVFEVTHANGTRAYSMRIEAEGLRDGKIAGPGWTVVAQRFRTLAHARQGTARSHRICRLEREKERTVFVLMTEPDFKVIVAQHAADYVHVPDQPFDQCPSLGFSAD